MGNPHPVTMSGDMDLDALIDEYRGPLVSLLAAWGASPRDARELAQDTFAEAYVGRERFRGSPGDPVAMGHWLRGIAKNLHRAHMRRETGRGRLRAVESIEEVNQQAQDPMGEEASALEERGRALRTALESLPEQARVLLVMRYLEGSSLATIGGLLGLEGRAVEGRLRRARAALSQKLQHTSLSEDES